MNPSELTDFLEKKWSDKIGLKAALVLITLVLFPVLLGQIGIWWSLLATLLTNFTVAAFWWWSRQPPVTPDNKIGFLICISCSDDKESEKLQEDFTRPLRGLIKSGKTGHAFHVLEMPEHISSTILDEESAIALRIKCRATFMIYGHVRLRNINGKETHVLNLEGIVAHNPVPENVNKNLANEFAELLPRKLHVIKENDILSLQFTSEWTDAVARYVIGWAAAISGDLDYAEALFLDVKERLHKSGTKFPIYIKLKERVPVRISELYKARALKGFYKWAENKEVEYLYEAEANLEQLIPSHKEEKEVLNLKAILAFVLHKDIKKAMALLNQVKSTGQPLWHLNMAFLLGYNKQLKNAIRHYRLAANVDTNPEIISQVEDFIVWVLENEPYKYYLYYCLGFFNWKIKGDHLQAVKDFEQFLAHAKKTEFEQERALATKWVAEINKK